MDMVFLRIHQMTMMTRDVHAVAAEFRNLYRRGNFVLLKLTNAYMIRNGTAMKRNAL